VEDHVVAVRGIGGGAVDRISVGGGGGTATKGRQFSDNGSVRLNCL